MANHFLEGLVGAVYVFVFNVQHRVDPVLVLQGPKAVLPLEPGIGRTVVKRRLGVQIEFGGPPGRCSILQFSPVGMKVVSSALCAERREVFDCEVSRLLKVVIVGDKVRILLGRQGP